MLIRIFTIMLALVGVAIAQTPVPPTFFGMHTTALNVWPEDVGALGKGTLVSWEYSEPARGVYNWSTLDNWVNMARAYGVPLVYSNDGIPAWAVDPNATSQCLPTPRPGILNCLAMVENIADWDHFVTALATRYKGKLIYELWNEPSDHPYLTVNDMVTLITHELNIIRSIDPNATILCCGFTPYKDYIFMDKFYAAGGPRNADGIGFHGQFKDSTLPPEWIASEVDIVRSVLAKYGISDKPLYDTEGGWYVKSPPADSAKPPFLAKWYMLQWSKGVSSAYWFAWNTWRPLWDPTTGINKTGVAYEQVYKWMVGAEMSRTCGLRADGTTWTCGFARAGGYVGKVIWNTAGSKAYKPGSQYTQYRTLSGKTVAIIPGRSVTIGLSPIMLENFTP